MNTLGKPTDRTLNGVPDDPDSAAAYWSARRRLKTLDAGEEAAFSAWLANPANGAAFEAIEQPIEDIGELASFSEIRAMREAALGVTPGRLGRTNRWRTTGLGLLAASLAGVVVLAGQGFINHKPVQGSAPAAVAGTESAGPSDAAVERYATRVGERSDITLADGSVVSLNTASLVEVAYTRERRDVLLLQGQALFKVAKNKTRPFVVTAGDRRITATGTAFDVRLDHGRVRVVLVEGHVMVTPLARTGLAALLPAMDQQELAAGEVLTAAPAQPVSVSATDVDQATSWRRGQVIFRDDSLAAAVTEMNRYSDDQLLIQDPRVASLKISGVFGVARRENFIAAVTAFYPITAVQRSPGVTALVWRGGNSTAGG